MEPTRIERYAIGMSSDRRFILVVVVDFRGEAIWSSGHSTVGKGLGQGQSVQCIIKVNLKVR